MFKNYESAKIEFTELKKTFINYEIGERTIFGYGINAIVNSKNKEGVYTGRQNSFILFKRQIKSFIIIQGRIPAGKKPTGSRSGRTFSNKRTFF
jgi:hypothetical protein